MSGSPSATTSSSRLISLLAGGHPDLPLVAPVQAEGHPHHAVEIALVAVTEAHHGDLAEVVRAGDRDRRRLGHPTMLPPPTDTRTCVRWARAGDTTKEGGPSLVAAILLAAGGHGHRRRRAAGRLGRLGAGHRPRSPLRRGGRARRAGRPGAGRSGVSRRDTRRPSWPAGSMWRTGSTTAGKVRVILVSGDNMAPEYNENLYRLRPRAAAQVLRLFPEGRGHRLAPAAARAAAGAPSGRKVRRACGE